MNGQGTTYSPEDVDRGLLALAIHGAATRAATALEQQGHHIPERTLADWRTRHADRYHEIANQHARRVEDVIVQQARDAALMAGALEQDLMHRLATKAGELEAKDLANSVKNVTTTKGINVDKFLTLTGRPNHVTEHRNADELLRKLDALKVHAIQGEATEQPQPPETPGRSLIAEGRKTNARELGPGREG